MKTSVRFLIAALLISPSFAQAAQEFRGIERQLLTRGPPPGSFELRCRGGAVSTINVTQYSAGNTQVLVRFTKGTKPAGAGLAPGECSWLDRAFRADEPTNLCQQVDQVFFTLQHAYDTRYNPSDLWIMQSAYSRAAPWLELAHTPEKYFNLYVTADAPNNCMIVKGQP